ncbi:15304_t:CDS:1, partial [Gigaspora rosea]
PLEHKRHYFGSTYEKEDDDNSMSIDIPDTTSPVVSTSSTTI